LQLFSSAEYFPRLPGEESVTYGTDPKNIIEASPGAVRWLKERLVGIATDEGSPLIGNRIGLLGQLDTTLGLKVFLMKDPAHLLQNAFKHTIKRDVAYAKFEGQLGTLQNFYSNSYSARFELNKLAAEVGKKLHAFHGHSDTRWLEKRRRDLVALVLNEEFIHLHCSRDDAARVEVGEIVFDWTFWVTVDFLRLCLQCTGRLSLRLQSRGLHYNILRATQEAASEELLSVDPTLRHPLPQEDIRQSHVVWREMFKKKFAACMQESLQIPDAITEVIKIVDRDTWKDKDGAVRGAIAVAKKYLRLCGSETSTHVFATQWREMMVLLENDFPVSGYGKKLGPFFLFHFSNYELDLAEKVVRFALRERERERR
jgi:hypothetical protein